MTDRYQQFSTSGVGRLLVKRLGLPNPEPLRRYKSGEPALTGPALVGGTGRLVDAIGSVLKSAGIEVLTAPAGGDTQKYGGLVFDATGITDPTQLRALYDFFHPVMRSITPSGRIVVLGTPPESATAAGEIIAQRSLEGFTRSLGKELKRGATAQLVYVQPGAEDKVESTLRFLLSAKSAYVDGQVIRIGTHGGAVTEPESWTAPLAGKVALVTGASRGIGAAIAEVLARDGAHVIALDIPAQGGDLAKVANKVGGSTFQLDVTAADAPAKLIEYLKTRHGGVDIVVHNAGITRDKTLANMKEGAWDSVLAVNLTSQLKVNEALLAEGVLREGGRIIGVSSIAGIAGNLGQTNYGTSKAAVIGMVNAYADEYAAKGITINAVAPGFIETQMTAAVPLFIREAGRRMNSMQQGGLPVDVAETIAWYASPASGAVNGNVVRVCGQSLLGA
ncbi:3-oxoacyl-[acyl-carrier protein] reductase [Actinokineospora alba]|uniref:3-oxoacyl-[acyl-carrier protein] reductase n=1 Tax=Actinokineospora alba TaxID=504798 RepID=A0A1H0Q446_9PSEU|nr:3-oxoacyl-ACP reductase [Actinokineospora alba]TDP66038.1 3-oxoacyl-[acyl-carrier protein] reductase [Actinokineospora alba]SDI59357.1 3-oxoacyl-[acyl-carrier protein] reductase [Actinokineospora alba]SDP11399.1 3-oxoacyl-[acyl-carrier protein] reductase [Actinokineospora alba]